MGSRRAPCFPPRGPSFLPEVRGTLPSKGVRSLLLPPLHLQKAARESSRDDYLSVRIAASLRMEKALRIRRF